MSKIKHPAKQGGRLFFVHFIKLNGFCRPEKLHVLQRRNTGPLPQAQVAYFSGFFPMHKSLTFSLRFWRLLFFRAVSFIQSYLSQETSDFYRIGCFSLFLFTTECKKLFILVDRGIQKFSVQKCFYQQKILLCGDLKGKSENSFSKYYLNCFCKIFAEDTIVFQIKNVLHKFSVMFHRPLRWWVDTWELYEFKFDIKSLAN